jgi:hypothetical protein
MSEICTGQWAEAPEDLDWCVSFTNTPEFWAQGFLECCLLLLVIFLIDKGLKRFKKDLRKVYVVPPTHSPYDESPTVYRKRRRW